MSPTTTPDQQTEIQRFTQTSLCALCDGGSSTHSQELTARALLQSELVGLWEDRDDISDSLTFARQLRRRAEHRRRMANDDGDG
jgi:hypothetical protein